MTMLLFVRSAALAGILAGLSGTAFAHARPKVASPAANATVEAPKEVSIEFTEAVDPKFSSLQLLGADGKVIQTQPTVADAADHAHLRLPLPQLAPGTYTVHWVTSALDGHHLDGSYNFMVK